MFKTIFGASWRTSVSGIAGGLAVALWPTIQDAINNQLHGVEVKPESILSGAVIAIVAYFAKDKAVSNSPTPLAQAKVVQPAEMAKEPITK